MTKPRRKIALRIYAFTAAIAVAAMVALLVLPRFIGSPRYLGPQAALVQNMVDRLAQRDPAGRAERIAHLAPRLRAKLTMFDTRDNVLNSTSDALQPPTPEERRTLAGDEKWALSWGRIVVRSDDGTAFGVYEPEDPGRPWGLLLELAAGVLVVAGAASLWFSRGLVRPLGRLADAARQFGGGDTAARAQLQRDDELGQVGSAFDDMADRTAALLASQRQLMADVSHELRTPLARIRVALELVSEDPVAAKDVLNDVTGDLDEIDQLISDILTTARLDADPTPIKRQPMPVGDLAERAVGRFKARHPRRELERGDANGSTSSEVDCDPVLLRRALDNLLDNAAKYSEAPVRLEVRPDKGAIVFEVIDRGIGMSPEELERAFTPFWRADQSRARKTGGVGLGLALARRIARAHGGDVTLASQPGSGTTARLQIPLLHS